MLWTKTGYGEPDYELEEKIDEGAIKTDSRKNMMKSLKDNLRVSSVLVGYVVYQGKDRYKLESEFKDLETGATLKAKPQVDIKGIEAASKLRKTAFSLLKKEEEEKEN